MRGLRGVRSRVWRAGALVLVCGLGLVAGLSLTERVGASAPGEGSLADLPEPLRFAASREMGADDERYRFARSAGSWAVEANGLTTRVDASGTVVSAPGWSWGLRLRGTDGGSWSATANELRRIAPGVEEWWVAGPLGVQQGWTVAARPVTGLLLRFAELGSQRARVVRGGARLDLGSGRRFEGLQAIDARGRALPARFVRDADGFGIRVDDRGATYPVTVDPWVQAPVLAASSQYTADRFGSSVAVSGDTVVVGASTAEDSSGLNEGLVYVFVKPGGGWSSTMTEDAVLRASEQGDNDDFGASVAISGDTVVVGATTAEDSSGSAEGLAYVFVKPAGGWGSDSDDILTEDAVLKASEQGDTDWFGFGVAVSGDTVVVGAYAAEDSSGSGEGLAYVFVKPAGGWGSDSDDILTEDAVLKASEQGNTDSLGYSVAVSCDTVVVGAYQAEDASGTDEGLAYVFAKPAGGWGSDSDDILTEDAVLAASEQADTDNFGWRVAVSGRAAVVGAWLAEDASGGGTDEGLAYVFSGSSACAATLSALALSVGDLSPAFAAETTTYTASVSNDTSSITVTPTTTDSGATMQVRVNGGSYSSLSTDGGGYFTLALEPEVGGGSYSPVASGMVSEALPLNVGSNTVEVLVTAEDGSTATYSVTVTRAAAAAVVVVPRRAGYCLAGRFLDLEFGQPDTDPVYQRVTPSWFVEGRGITCDTPPYGYILDGKAPWTMGVPHNFYDYWRAK